MIGHSDIKLGEISPSPSPLSLPFPSTTVTHSQHTQKRDEKVLVQRVPNKPNVLVSHQIEEPGRVDPIQIAGAGQPLPGIDPRHVVPLIPDAVPGISVEGAGGIVDGFASGIKDPAAVEEIARGRGQNRVLGRGEEREEGGVEEDEEAGREE